MARIMCITNEGIIDQKAIKGFYAERMGNGNYRIYAKTMHPTGFIGTHEVTNCKPEEFVSVWKGIRSLAILLTNDCFTITI